MVRDVRDVSDVIGIMDAMNVMDVMDVREVRNVWLILESGSSSIHTALGLFSFATKVSKQKGLYVVYTGKPCW